MDITQMRYQLLHHAYPLSKTWPDRVKKMSDSQIVAVWTRLNKQKHLRKL